MYLRCYKRTRDLCIKAPLEEKGVFIQKTKTQLVRFCYCPQNRMESEPVFIDTVGNEYAFPIQMENKSPKWCVRGK